MNRFFKFISIAAIVGSGIYLLLEIFKLRNKIQLLEMELQTTERFKADQVGNDIVADSNTHTDTIHSEILEYEKELEQVDQLINNLNTSHNDKITEETDIELEQEDIDLDNLETNINELNISVEDHTSEQDVQENQDVQDAQENNDTSAAIKQQNINDIQTSSEPNEDLIKHYTQKYSKKKLQDLCGSNKISKKGTKRDLILKLLTQDVLDTEEITTSIDAESNTPQDDTPQDDTPQDDTDNVAFNEVPIEHTTTTHSVSDVEDDTTFSLPINENMDTDSMLYKLKQFNQRSNHDDSIHLNM